MFKSFHRLQKNSLAEVIKIYGNKHSLLQVTTFSRLLTVDARNNIREELNKDYDDIVILPLQQINTEEQFSKRINAFLEHCQDSRQILIVQSHINKDTPNSLVECARYSIMNQVLQYQGARSFCIVLVLQVPRVHGGFFSGFPGTPWKALHIDELCGNPSNINMADWNNKSLHEVLEGDEKEVLKKIIADCIPRSASLAYKNGDALTSSRIVHCIEVLKNCLDSDQVK